MVKIQMVKILTVNTAEFQIFHGQNESSGFRKNNNLIIKCPAGIRYITKDIF